MRDGWRKVPLGELFEMTNNRLGRSDREPEVLSVTKHEGMVRARDYFDKRVASARLDTYKVVDADEWAYSTIHIDEGSITRNRTGALGVVSPMYTTMRLVSTDALPFFCELALRTPEMLARYGDAQQGSINRRRSLPWKVFSSLTLSLPPLEEQRRIVNLIGAVDSASAAAEEGARAISAARGPLIGQLLAQDDDWPQHPLGEVGTFIRGRRFTKSEYVESGLGCIHYGQLYTSLGSLTTAPLTFLPEEAATRLRLARTGDVIVAATSENLADLGRATAWLGDDQVAVHDDCYIYRHELDARFATYLFASPAFQAQKAQFAAGVKVTRISGADLAAVTLPIPPMETQTRIGETLARLDEQLRAYEIERARLDAVRVNLLTVLLSGEHEIPESYDELLAG